MMTIRSTGTCELSNFTKSRCPSSTDSVCVMTELSAYAVNVAEVAPSPQPSKTNPETRMFRRDGDQLKLPETVPQVKPAS